jgi:hypothetical protein
VTGCARLRGYLIGRQLASIASFSDWIVPGDCGIDDACSPDVVLCERLEVCKGREIIGEAATRRLKPDTFKKLEGAKYSPEAVV